ncbi:hypothetical protein [Candidatus Venteria ishoeyi]|uniref:Uncharacterized protein n=1 Tax=Candidatus Venteria ishoeyi TaxID=1899563 RepID=A0A1H6FE98_9GAMM|nr:hypothetical protein [Candidatus Venteria ishoeyi]SEH07344.1 Uncharacterised protein [Candidatus Venteria ishoeyi]
MTLSYYYKSLALRKRFTMSFPKQSELHNISIELYNTIKIIINATQPGYFWFEVEAVFSHATANRASINKAKLLPTILLRVV